MRIGSRCGRPSLVWLLVAGAYVSTSRAIITPYLPQSWFFDWNPQGQEFPVTVTQQCETIHIKWDRASATGPNPVAPYYLQVYTSLYLSPIIIPAGEGLSYDWAVPFPPGTQYQICMFDKNGNTGGCQATYTVIPSMTTTEPTCANVTLPAPLEVEGMVNNGPISRYGWIEQCTDIQVTPKGGKPPYTFTIAPSLHPPYNITGEGSMNWTVHLTWASPFFISVADSEGSVWSHGLLHAGGPGTDDCLVSKKTDGGQIKPAVAIGAGVGGLAVGAVLGLLIMFFLMRRKIKVAGRGKDALLDVSVPTTPMPFVDHSTHGPPATHTSQQYHVEPFTMPNEHGARMQTWPSAQNLSTAPSGGVVHPPVHASVEGSSTAGSVPGQPRNKGAVYVLHHDSNTAPVTIYHEEGQEIVELPPLYPQEVSPTGTSASPPDGRSDGTPSDGGRTESSGTAGPVPPPFLQQQRRPNQGRKPTKKSTKQPHGPR